VPHDNPESSLRFLAYVTERQYAGSRVASALVITHIFGGLLTVVRPARTQLRTSTASDANGVTHTSPARKPWVCREKTCRALKARFKRLVRRADGPQLQQTALCPGASPRAGMTRTFGPEDVKSPKTARLNMRVMTSGFSPRGRATHKCNFVAERRPKLHSIVAPRLNGENAGGPGPSAIT